MYEKFYCDMTYLYSVGFLKKVGVMNVLPKEFIRVSYDNLYDFTSTAAQSVGLPKDKSDLLAQLLATNDLRGVFSHGTQQIATYAILMRDGVLNNMPDVKPIRESAVSVLMDGDGGLGYFPAYEGTVQVIEKAKAQGIAVMQSRNHGHFGAAGIYSRLTLGHDLLAFVTSGHQLNLRPDDPIYSAGGGSPMSFCTPTDKEDPLVLDFGAMHDLYGGYRDAIAKLAPSTVFRSIGLGGICQSWGGLLAGVPMEEERADKKFKGANQGSLVVAFRIDLFMEPQKLKEEMDLYVQKVRALKPLEGFDACYVAGGLEAERERINREAGIPVGERHRKRLEKLADELGIAVTW